MSGDPERTTFEPFLPDTDPEKLKQRAIWRVEGVAALSVLAGMRVCVSALEEMRASDDPFVRTALFSGLVVNYARAFEEAKDEKTQTVRRFSIRKLPAPFDRKLHDTIIAMRNEQIAHAGHSQNDYNLTFLIAKLKVESPQPDGEIMRQEMRHILGTRARASLASGISTADAYDNLLAHLRAVEKEAAQRLGVAIVEHDAASIFRLEEDAQGYAVMETLKTNHGAAKWPGIVRFGEEDLAFSLAKRNEILPLQLTVMHCNVVEKDGAFNLNWQIVEE